MPTRFNRDGACPVRPLRRARVVTGHRGRKSTCRSSRNTAGKQSPSAWERWPVSPRACPRVHVEGAARIDATQGARRPPLLLGGRSELGSRNRCRRGCGTTRGGAHGCCGLGGRRSRATARTRTRRVPHGVATSALSRSRLLLRGLLGLLPVRLAVAALRVVSRPSSFRRLRSRGPLLGRGGLALGGGGRPSGGLLCAGGPASWRSSWPRWPASWRSCLALPALRVAAACFLAVFLRLFAFLARLLYQRTCLLLHELCAL